MLTFLIQKHIVSENSKLSEDLHASKTNNDELACQLGKLQQSEIAAAVREAAERRSELSNRLRVALEARELAEKCLEQEQARFAYLSSFDKMVNGKMQDFENDMIEDMMTLKDAASALFV